MMDDRFTAGFMQPEDETGPNGTGALAEEPIGGLSRFLGNVERGVTKVLSHPLYHRLWSGAVSAASGDPMAGPRALAEINAPSGGNDLSKHLQFLRIKQLEGSMEDAERKRRHGEALAQAIGSGDQRSVVAELAQYDPTRAASEFLRPPPASAQPRPDWQYDGKGNKRRALLMPDGTMSAIPNQPWIPASNALVEINNGPGGLDMNQIANASRAERAAFVEQMKPFESFDRAIGTIRNVRQMADERGVLPQQASQIIASDAMAALRPEALNEGDVARLTAVGLWNKLNAAIGLPPQMTVEQLDTLAKMIEDKAREAEPKRRALIEDGRFRAQQFGFSPRLILGEYESWKPSDRRAEQQAPPRSNPGATPRPVRARPLP